MSLCNTLERCPNEKTQKAPCPSQDSNEGRMKGANLEHRSPINTNLHYHSHQRLLVMNIGRLPSILSVL